MAGSLPRVRRPSRQSTGHRLVAMAHLSLVAIVVHEYDPAIAFFVDVLGFTPTLSKRQRSAATPALV